MIHKSFWTHADWPIIVFGNCYGITKSFLFIFIIIIVIIFMMVNTLTFFSKEIGKKFFAKFLAPKNQSGKATAAQCKVNIYQNKMVTILVLKKHIHCQPVCT